MSGTKTEGLRERRRRQTAVEIHEAAIACFEEDGLEHVTVAQIAERAGVSPRTFFRYYHRKEQAALPGQGTLRAALVELEPQAGPHAVGHLMDLLTRVIAEDPTDPVRHRRIGALLEAEPALRAHVAHEDAEMVRQISDRLTLADPDMDVDGARLVAEIAMGAWRVAWAGWDREGPTQRYPTPLARWLGVRSGVMQAARAVGNPTPAP